MQPGEMLTALFEVESALPMLLLDEDRWQSLDVNYEHPRVERLWTQVGTWRVNLHRIHPCARALFHPHPWPSAVLVVSGKYEMGVGYGAGGEPPPEAVRLILTAGARYEMVDPDGWHSVRPLHESSLSLMVTGEPWRRQSPGKGVAHEPLPKKVKLDFLAQFHARYPRQ